MGKKIAAILMSVAVALSSFTISGTQSVAESGGEVVLYDLQKDAELKANGFGASLTLVNSGSPSISVVNFVTGGDESISLLVEDRSKSYDGVDILREALQTGGLFLTGTYTFTVEGRVAQEGAGEGIKFVLGMTESPWRELTSAATDSNGRFQLTYTINNINAVDMASLGYNFRIQTSQIVPFYIDNIVVTVQAAEDAADPEITELLRFTFDDEADQDGLFTVASSSEIAWVTEAGIGHGDDTVLKVTHTSGTSYTSMYNAVRLFLPTALLAGGTYQVSAWVYAPAEGNLGKGTLAGPGIVLNDYYEGATGESKFPANAGTLPIGEWKQIIITLPMMETPLTSIDFRLVTNAEESHADIWYLDDIVISRIGEVKEVIIPEWDLTIGSLKEAYADYFLMGNVMEPSQTTDEKLTAMYRHYYNVVTTENTMKPVNLTSAKGVYTFDKADTIVSWAKENGIDVHGHTLIWHSQSAAWLTYNSDGSILTRAEAKENMEAYINTVAEHFKGQVISWDVVNEAFRSGVSAVPEDWRDALRKDEGSADTSSWYLAYANGADSGKGESGADYIYDAFVLTRLADPNAVLYYNDYNENQAGKREAIATMVEELNAMWKTDSRNTQPERLLIEGIGMQSHFYTQDYNLINSVEAAIVRFIETGCEISVTELDIPWGTYANYRERTTDLTEEEQIIQAELYKQLFEIYCKYADNIERVTFWGKADTQSWRSEGRPTLFDRYFAPKAAYREVMGVAEAASAVAVTGVKVNGASLVSLKAGDTVTLTAALTPVDATNKAVVWSVSNSSVAEIDENGVITAKASGMVVVTVTTEDGGYTGTVVLKVSP